MSNTPKTFEDPVPATTAPALNPPTWSGRKTAVAAALAIGISAAGTAAAVAAVPVGSALSDQGQFQRGGFPPGGFQPGGPGGPGIAPNPNGSGT